MPTPIRSTRLFGLPSWSRAQYVASALRSETIGGLLLVTAAGAALIWANSPWQESYTTLVGFRFGPAAWHLDLTVVQWAADGLLAIFFFVVGLELKREFVEGELRSPSRAVLPIVAAVGGMLVPALIYLAVNLSWAGGSTRGWAVPTATDIAFAVAVLAIIGSHLPAALRSFLLTLAVVDDLLAVTIIAIFFTDQVSVLPLLGSLGVLALCWLLARQRWVSGWLLLPLGVLAWALMHGSGVHATLAGVLLGFTIPTSGPEPDTISEATPSGQRTPGEQRTPAGSSMAQRLEHQWRPVSAGIAVPIFALTAAGVSLAGGGLAAVLRDPAAVGVALGLVAGKLVGVLAATYLLARFTRAALDPSLSWWDVLGVALLAGIGFTVALLIGELAFDADGTTGEHVKAAVLLGSITSALLATIVLRWRNRVYRRIHEDELRDSDHDGVPDIYQAALTQPGTRR